MIDLADVERNIGTLDAFDDDFLNSEQQITKEIDASWPSVAVVTFSCRREVFCRIFRFFKSSFRKKVVVILDDDLRSKQCR